MALFLYWVKQTEWERIKANGKQTSSLVVLVCLWQSLVGWNGEDGLQEANVRGLSRPRRCCGTDTPWTLRCGCGGWLRPGSCSRPPFWFWDTAASAGHGAPCWSPPPAGAKSHVHHCVQKRLSELDVLAEHLWLAATQKLNGWMNAKSLALW